MFWKEEEKQEITKICKDRFRRRKTVSKVFGYPKFDEYGEMILTTYDNDYKAMMMDIRVYSMKAGYSRTFKRAGRGDRSSSPLGKSNLCMGK